MFRNLSQFVLAGTLLLVASCAVPPGSLPGAAPVAGQVPAARLDLGLAGDGYAIQAQGAIATGSSAASGSFAATGLTYSHVLFTPTKIELHFAGTFSATESAADPVDLRSATTDESALNDSDGGDADPIASDSAWIDFPVQNAAAIDLANLAGTQVISFGENVLSQPGKYDEIRVTGGGTYEAVDASGSAVTGAYFLPSGRLYLQQGFEIRPGYETDLKFNFDAKDSMVKAGTKILLKPNAVKVNARYLPVPVATPSPSAS